MTRSPLYNLVLFLLGLALSGTIVAGVYYAAIDLPMQQANPAPLNVNLNDPGACAKCIANCGFLHPFDDSCPKKCLRSCDCIPGGCPDR